MKWLWFRRKRPAATTQAAAPTNGHLSSAPHDALLRFALDYLRTKRLRVALEESDVVGATFPDGTSVRYTTSAARARADEQTHLLAIGSSALNALLDEVGAESRYLALALAPHADPHDVLSRALAPVPDLCGSCLAHATGSKDAPLARCAQCPLQSGALALRLPDGKRSVTFTPAGEELSVECTYRLSGHDHSGRHDAWVRLATTADGRQLRPLDEALLASARAYAESSALHGVVTAAQPAIAALVQPILAASAHMLRARGEGTYQRRIADTRATFTRLRQEQTQPTGEIDAALTRELATLADVFGIEVEASLESLCLISAPVVEARIICAGASAPVVLRIDAGRGEVIDPVCAACGARMRAGAACSHGHLLCSACVRFCADGGEVLCPLCAVAADSADHDRNACTLCAAPLCADHILHCAGCGAVCCSAHLWRCDAGGESLCLECARPCEDCGHVSCDRHPHAHHTPLDHRKVAEEVRR